MIVRFKNRWRQFAPGDTTGALDEGIAATLVSRGMAEKVEPERKSILRSARDKMIRSGQATVKAEG